MARKSRKNIPEAVPVHNDLFINTALYIRLSVEDGKKRSNSIENQQLIINDYISDKPEFKVYDTYIDNGLTGATFDRPSFQRMLSDIEAGYINCVIVKDLSRLGRNAIDTGYYIEQYFPKNKVRFIAVTDSFDTANPSRSSGIMLPLKNMINEAYAIDIGRKIRAQAHQDMLDGNFVGARAPFGYRKDPDNCHKLLIDEATAPIVRQIFEWSAAGIGVNVIAIKLNELHTVTSSEYKRSTSEPNKRYKHSSHWNSFTVQHILDNPVYTGDMVQGKSKTIERHRQIAVSPDEYIIVRGTHEPIVSREMFEKAKQLREAVREEYKQKSVDPYTENIFKGIIFCAHCGKPLHRCRQKRKTKADNYSFRCIANSRIAKGVCVGVHIYENKVIEAVASGIRDIVGKYAYSSAECSSVKRQKAQLTKSISEYQSELEKVLSFVRSLYENFVEGIISNDEYACEYGRIAPDRECKDVSIRVEDLERTVFDTIRSQAQCFVDTDADIKARAEKSALELNGYEQKLKLLQESKRELYEQYILGILDIDTYKSKKAELEIQLADMKHLCSVVADKAKTAQEDYEESIKNAEIAASIDGADSLTKALVDKLVERVYVFPNNRIEIKYATRRFM